MIKQKNRNTFTGTYDIIVNGVAHKWHPNIIMIHEVGKLAYQDSDWYKELLEKSPLQIKPRLEQMSCSFKNAHPEGAKSEGILSRGGIVRIQDGTIFNIMNTSNA